MPSRSAGTSADLELRKPVFAAALPIRIPLGLLAPFAFGYFLSYLFRTINGPLAQTLKAEFALGEQDLGLLTSAYFLTFAACQLPLGAALDRFGPRRVQIVLLSVASLGAFAFARADGPVTLTVARALIGIGTAGALMAGLKALVAVVPRSQLGLANGLFIMAGGLGATAGTLPVQTITDAFGWRGTFAVLGALTLVATAWLAWLAPATPPAAIPPTQNAAARTGIGIVLRSRQFWRLAPLSAGVIGTAFAEHGLWASRWMEIDGLSAPALMRNLTAMGLGLTVGAAMLGTAASALRVRGVPTALVFLLACLAFAGVQLLLVCQIALPAWLPGWLPWSVLAMFGAMTTLSYSVTGETFPQEMIGRVNATLNVMHIGMAFALQAGMGFVVALWPTGPDGHAPLAAFRAAFALPIALQALGMAWFIAPAATLGRRSR
jgi:MFS family permease